MLGQFGRVRHHLKFGFKRIEVGFESLKLGSEHVKVKRIEVGFESVKLGPEQVKVKPIEVGFESVKLGPEQVDGIFFWPTRRFVDRSAMVCTARPIRTTKRSPIPRYSIDIDSVGMGALRRLAPPAE